MQFITVNNLHALLKNLGKDYEVFVPVKRGQNLIYKRYRAESDQGGFSPDIPVIGEVRAFDPLKAFFSRARERVADGFSADLPRTLPKPLCIVGAKACDLKGFKVQDFVFMEGDFKDPFYIRAREENIVIAADCTCAIDTCFCLAVGVNPYPTEGFDINLSEVSSGFIVEPGSDKGRTIVEKYSGLFGEASDAHMSERDRRRKKVAAEVKNGIQKIGVPSQDQFEGIIQSNFDSEIWKEEAESCVECGACNTVCPTCHCFLLYDQKDKGAMERLRVWDSCMIKDFALVAAGVNPRPSLWMRLRNRFEKKFDFFPKLANVYACTGCGRCVSACPAKIDIRKVLQRLVKDGAKQPV
jgi:sulfhydrogenase subunit beta (sulfur reductase)